MQSKELFVHKLIEMVHFSHLSYRQTTLPIRIITSSDSLRRNTLAVKNHNALTNGKGDDDKLEFEKEQHFSESFDHSDKVEDGLPAGTESMVCRTKAWIKRNDDLITVTVRLNSEGLVCVKAYSSYRIETIVTAAGAPRGSKVSVGGIGAVVSTQHRLREANVRDGDTLYVVL